MREKILPCKCHKVQSNGALWSKNYQFSQKGMRGIQTRTNGSWKKLSCSITSKGYLQISLHGRIVRVNRLIAFNFIPNELCFPEVHHIDDNKINNDISNLRWGNAKMNAGDRERNGNTVKGVRNFNAKLNDKKVKEIRKLRGNGMTFQSIADQYGVSKKLILLISQNKIWKHV